MNGRLQRHSAPVRAVLFDFAGTLTHLPAHFDHRVPWLNYLDTLNEDLAQYGSYDHVGAVRALVDAEAESWRDCVEGGIAWSLDDLLRCAGLPYSARAARRYFESFASGTGVSTEAAQLLQTLSTLNIPTAVLSNSLWPRDWITECLDSAGVLPCLKDVIVSSEHTYCKPHPEFFNQGRRRLGLPADQILMVGDRLYEDIYGGYRAGMQTALVPGGKSQSGTEIVAPDHRLVSLADVLALVA
ncbi:HAD family hydrolase [Paenarthrobacter ureafaciens]|uniref:HAD family hydrolase n=1 Tax=Paenarthrobacter ureafaciens TaxID=37931 RepID=UPI003119AC24